MYILLSENLQYFPSDMSTYKQSGHRHEKTRPDKHTRNNPIQKTHQGLKYCIYKLQLSYYTNTESTGTHKDCVT